MRTNISTGQKTNQWGRRRSVLRAATAAAVGSVALASHLGHAATFTYTPSNATTDLWSTGTNWDAAPTGAASNILNFSSNATALADGLVNANTNDLTGLFQLNIMNLNGTGPNTGAATITIASTSPATGLNFITSGTAPTINLNAMAGAAGLSYVLSSPITFSNTTNITGSGTANFKLTGNLTLTGSANNVVKGGTSTLTFDSGTSTFAGTYQAGGGTTIFAGGSLTALNFQNTGNGAILNQTGGTITSQADSRLSLSNSQWNISGGTFNVNKMVVGANSGTTNAVLTVSGNATVNQNQTTTNNHEIWVGGNNGGSGSLILKDSAIWNGGPRLNNGTFVAIVGNNGVGQGVFTIQDSAQFNWTPLGTQNSNLIRVADLVGNGGTVNLNGGTVTTLGFSKGAGTGTINANGGTVKAAGVSSNYFANFVGTGGNNSVNLGGTGGLTFHNNGFAVSITNVLSGTGGLTKTGVGVLTLTSASTYTGDTVINQDVVNLLGSLTSNISISGTGGIGTYSTATATGSTTGSLTFSGSSTTLIVNPNGSQFLTTGGAVTATGASVMVQPTITVPAANTPIKIMYAQGGITGTAGAPGSGANFVPGVRGTLSIVPDPSTIGQDLILTAASPFGHLIWKGNQANPTFWDTQVTPNWTNSDNGNAIDQFYANDAVTFDDSATTFSVAVQGASQTPSTVTFSNTPAKTYTLLGGAIAGTATVTVNGGGTVIFTNNNTYSGNTTIASGTLQLGDGTNATGKLGTGTVTNNGALVINYGTNNGTLSNVVVGTGSLTYAGAATLNVTSANTYSGATNINSAGTVQLSGTGALGSGQVNLNGAVVATGNNLISGNIVGTGSLTTNTGGTLTLAGNNTGHTGSTLVNTGSTLQIGNNGTTGTLPGGPMTLNGTLNYNRSDSITIPSFNTTATLGHVGSGTVTLSGTNAVGSLNVGFNAAAGSLIVPAGVTVAIGSAGVGSLNIGSETGNNLAGNGVLDATAAGSFSANVANINVGVTANNNIVTSAKLMLPPSSNLTAANAVLIGDSGGARNQQDDVTGVNIQLTTAPGGTTTVRTPIFSVGGSKTSASMTLGAGNTLDLTGTGTTPRTRMGVGLMITGGGGGNYYQVADLSQGILKANLSGLFIADQQNNSGATSSTLNSTMTISTDPANHLDISGVSTATNPVGNDGLLVIGRQGNITATGFISGALTIGNLDATSAITSTDGGTAILVAGGLVEGYSQGTLNLNGGTVTITTTGAAIRGGIGNSTVFFNGMQFNAGASSTSWITGITNAYVAAGGIKMNDGGNDLTIPQILNHDPNLGAGLDGGFIKSGSGSVTLAAQNFYNGPTSASDGKLILGVTTTNSSSVNASGNGRIVLSSDATFNKFIITPLVTASGNGKIDLDDNKMITQTPVGSWTGSSYTGVSGLVASGRNGNAWNGTGIVTSQSQAIGSNYTSLGVARASDVRPNTATESALWGGQTITGTDTLVMYTYGGDANLDGKLNVDDYIKIDSGIAANLTGWSNGDFNYDGKVNIDDYTTVIDANIGNQNGVFPTSGGLTGGGVSGVSAVPEPAGVSMIALAIGGLAGARRRRRRSGGVAR